MTLTVAFVSCVKYKVDKEQLVWDQIRAQSPDLLLLLGDTVYSPMYLGRTHKRRWRKWKPRKLRERYDEQFDVPSFKRVFAELGVYATWDDHDFGPNNCRGSSAPRRKKEASRQLFHEYMVQGDAATKLPNFPHIYHSFDRADTRFIMLDTRFFREKRGEGSSLLGAEQEAWFEAQLRHDQKFTVVCTGATLTHGKEAWVEYGRFYREFMRHAHGRRVLVLSGDRHENAFGVRQCVYEATSSAAARDGERNFGIAKIGEDRIDVELHGREGLREAKTLSLDPWPRT